MRVDVSSLPMGKVLVIGDSQVRHLGGVFCSRDSKRRTAVCFPGVGIGYLSDKLRECVRGEGDKPVICLSAGGNDVERTGSVELLRCFKEALGRIRDKGGVPVVCGIIPRRRVDDVWLSRALAVNSMLADHCKANRWTFVDNWDCFYGKEHLYARDGVHLSKKGVQEFADSLERVINPSFLG